MKICPFTGKPCLGNQCALFIDVQASSGSACAFALMAERLRGMSRENLNPSELQRSGKK